MFLMLLACVLTDDDVRLAFDPDGDGVGAPEDCAPLDATAYPGAEEIWYDGVDQDCDGGSDVDQDGDGAPIDIDCDDSDARVYPGAEEIWYDGVDQDCDGGNDYDQDGDGYPNDIDCDDSDARVVPGAEEICGDGVVNDCHGSEDEARAMCRLQGELSLAEADLKIVGENPGDNVAESVAGGGDVDGDGRSDLLVGAFGNDAGGSLAGAVYMLLSSGVLSGHGPTLNVGAAEHRYYGEQAEDRIGWSVAVLGDVDEDGLADRAIGSYIHDPAGAVYVHLSSEGGHTLAGTDTIGGLKWIGEADGDLFGFAVAAGGDLDGDGLADLIVGAHDNDSGGIVAGAAYLLLSDGELTDRDTVGDRVVADCKLIGEAAIDNAGISVAGAGDVDGDGLSDVLVGARGQDGGVKDAGAAYLLRSTESLDHGCGTMSLADADLKLYGEATDDSAGGWVSGAGDVDGDGHADVIISSFRHDPGGVYDKAGAAYLFLSDGSLEGLVGAVSLSSADVKIIGESAEDQAGYPVTSAGDVDGDGRADLLVGARGSSVGGVGAGAAYLLYASGAIDAAGSTLNLKDADLKLWGESADDFAASSVATAGDVNGDALSDILVTARRNDAGGEDAGAAYLLYGRSF
jgi:hypothetical protein